MRKLFFIIGSHEPPKHDWINFSFNHCSIRTRFELVSFDLEQNNESTINVKLKVILFEKI